MRASRPRAAGRRTGDKLCSAPPCVRRAAPCSSLGPLSHDGVVANGRNPTTPSWLNGPRRGGREWPQSLCPSRHGAPTCRAPATAILVVARLAGREGCPSRAGPRRLSRTHPTRTSRSSCVVPCNRGSPWDRSQAQHATLRGRISRQRGGVMRLHVAVLCATALGLCATSALAQRPSGRGPERRAQLLFKGITLTQEQQAKVDSIQTYYREQMPSFTPGSPPDSV